MQILRIYLKNIFKISQIKILQKWKIIVTDFQINAKFEEIYLKKKL